MTELIVCAAIKFEVRTPIQERNDVKGFEWVLPMVRHYDSDAMTELDNAINALKAALELNN